MRQIKFRGKNVDTGEWLYGSLGIDNRHDEGGYYIYNPLSGTALIEVIPATVGQFTGLKDKNEKDICENDICQLRKGNNYFLVFEHGAFVLYHTQHKDVINGGYLRWGLLSRAFELGEEFLPSVIGNICDNQELLKKN